MAVTMNPTAAQIQQLGERQQQLWEWTQAKHAAHRPWWRHLLSWAGGVLLTLIGLLMIVLPGPAFIVLPIGLALLSLEIPALQPKLWQVLVWSTDAQRKAQAATPRQRLAGVSVLLLLIVVAIGLNLWLQPWTLMS